MTYFHVLVSQKKEMSIDCKIRFLLGYFEDLVGCNLNFSIENKNGSFLIINQFHNLHILSKSRLGHSYLISLSNRGIFKTWVKPTIIASNWRVPRCRHANKEALEVDNSKKRERKRWMHHRTILIAKKNWGRKTYWSIVAYESKVTSKNRKKAKLVNG